MAINLPFNFNPRDYQLPVLKHLDNGGKRAFTVWHRRAGKDIVWWNYLIKRAFAEAGVYFYFLPTFTQGRKIIWDGITNDGFKVRDYIPEEIITNQNGTEMKTEIITADGRKSVIQVIGTDNYDAIRGTNPRGNVFSEYAYQNPQAWEVIKPILKLNGGWAGFNTTPQGENHAFELLEMARDNDDWFTQVLTVEDTDLVTKSDIEQERREGMSDEMIAQEYYCSFQGSLVGSYYGRLMDDAEREGRLTSVPYVPTLPVFTSWDLGMDDQMAIWFFQILGREIRVIDYYENNNEGLKHYAEQLYIRNYSYKKHYLPHDVEVRELGTGKSRRKTLESLDVKPIEVCAGVNPAERINATRNLLPRCWFDKVKCKQGIRALKSYRKEYDEKKKTYRDTPLHDWSSHGSDSFGQYAINFIEQRMSTKIKHNTSFNPHAHI